MENVTESPYRSLYRRFRPTRFAEVIGQDHVVASLRNAVRDNRVGHAYLLTGPRGTGKTTAARLLAKVLNCENPADGEPCCGCGSCRSIDAGTSFDLHELDAASHNKVDDIRDLLSKVHLGTPGRTKVYLLDEVHMLTAGAENALLKTLEEPPAHVVFILATTEAHKVVATVRSRTQRLDLNLVPADLMTAHVRWVVEQAGLEVDDDAIAHVVRVGGGSVRDTLSALDQVVAAGGVASADTSAVDIVDAIAASDVGRALAAVNSALSHGADPRTIGEQLIRSLRDVFLTLMGADMSHAAEADREQASAVAARVRPPAVTRALELIGSALVDMRQSPDPRIDLEVALVRLTRPETDSSVAGLAARVAQLEAMLAAGGPAPAASSAPPAPAVSADAPSDSPAVSDTSPGPDREPAAPAAPASARPADAARRQLSSRPARTSPTSPASPAEEATPPSLPSRARASAGPELRGSSERPPGDAPPESPPDVPPTAEPGPPVEPSVSAGADVPSRERVEAVWPAALAQLSKRASLRVAGGRFGESTAGGVVYLLPHEGHRRRCEEVLDELAAALSVELATKVRVVLAVDASAPDHDPSSASAQSAAGGSAPDDEESIDLNDLVDAGERAGTVLDRLTQTFPGAELITDERTP